MAIIDPDLPEGTDHIHPGSSVTSDAEIDARLDAAAERIDATAPDTDKPAIDWTTTREKLAGAGADLKGQATDTVRAYAVSGKDRAVSGLDGLARLIDEAAGTVDDKVGTQYGAYVRQAGEALSGFSDTLRGKDVDDLFADMRELVRKSPAVTIGAAAAIGFVLARVVKAGFDAAGTTGGSVGDGTSA